MKVRSPVLGYNHNVRYAERLWHVQTEDSGVQNPHIFTHLFHDGTILATKRLDYDPASEVMAVQKLMQTQHKAMLRELKAGAFDEKISKFLGVAIQKSSSAEEKAPDEKAQEVTDPEVGAKQVAAPEVATKEVAAPAVATPEAAAPQVAEPEVSAPLEISFEAEPDDDIDLSEPRPLTGPVEPFEEPPTDRTLLPNLDDRPFEGGGETSPDVMQAVAREESAPAEEAKTPDTDRKLTVPPPSRPSLSPLRPNPAARPPLPPLRPPVRPASSPSAARPINSAIPRQPAGIGGRRPQSGAGSSGGKPGAEGVVVARPAVIVGGSAPARPPGQVARAQPGRSSGRWHPVNSPPPTAPPPVDKSAQDNIFGGDLISEKSLDEVILAYLSEDLNDK
jgi:hypothetical protein